MYEEANAQVQFEAVGGHKSSIFYGKSTRDGRSTLRKTTTAWEVLYYLAMELAKEGADAEAPLKESDSMRTKFIHAAGKLSFFAPTLFALRFPEKFVPRAAELRLHVAQLNDWVVLEEGSPARALLGPLFHELFDGVENLKGYDADYDTGIWNIGLINEASNMVKPCVMDVKIGFIRHSPLTPEDKVERIMKKEHHSLMRYTAMRICGCQRYIDANISKEKEEGEGDAKQLMYERFGKEIGFAVSNVAELSNCLKLFLCTGVPLATSSKDGKLFFHPKALAGVSNTEKVKMDRRIADLRAQVRAVLQFFEETPQGAFLLQHMAFVSTSMLVLYDAAAPSATVRLRLIDFARSTWRKFNFDESVVGFVQGLNNIDTYLA
ncbi:hypothetical protein ABL78_4845 [Leptomonas seymouri]|uniref:Kinase n=1 Tax=Leptomonas seymouri TaxID=5684 RepID=A0A0N1IKC0_LEPSE|nr:hypothetical protein ABL78_4845 [Leptomonas seymouri]|eukprot:KPI86084.1 hypothetical protein ABL78_4845 [Leptomonas seymouri]